MCVYISVGGRGEGVKVRRRSGEQENSVWCVSWCGGDAWVPAAAADMNIDKAHTHTHSTLSIIHISQRADVDSAQAKLQRSTHRWVAVSTQRLQQWGCTLLSLFYLLNHWFFIVSEPEAGSLGFELKFIFYLLYLREPGAPIFLFFCIKDWQSSIFTIAGMYLHKCKHF